MKNVLCIILGGGRGSRLYPLTKDRAKPAVPLVGKYRLIDIPISNCLNSGFKKIWILTQFNSESLNKHIVRAYKFDFFSEGFVEIIAADQSMGRTDWFQGSADAVRKCLKHLTDPNIQYVLILSGDQLYRMDFGELLSYHKKNNSEITIACNTVGIQETPDLGIMGIRNNNKISEFIEKPRKKEEISHLGVDIEGDKKYLASMGIYLFNKNVLRQLLTENQNMDFGKEIIPEALAKKKTFAFIYDGYWKDIGCIEAFYKENLAFTERLPPLDLFDEHWQFFTRPRYLPLSKIEDSIIKKSVIADGAIIEKCRITHSIIGLRSKIRSGTVVEDSILMGADYYDRTCGIGKNCHIKKAIIDKNVCMGDNVKIINKKGEQDYEDEFCVIRNGIVIIPKNTKIPASTII